MKKANTTTTTTTTNIVMGLAGLKKIAAQVDTLETAHATSYKDVASALCAGLTSEHNSIHHAEYLRRRDAIASLVNPEYKQQFLKNVYRATEGLRPSLDVKRLDPIQAARKKAADKKQKQRVMAKIKKAQPKLSDAELKAKTDEAMKESRESVKEEAAMAKAKEKLIIMLEGIELNKVTLADVRQPQAAIAALVIQIKAL